MTLENIVGVVLGCNNYEIIDLGVMVLLIRYLMKQLRRMLNTGLSGLITLPR